MTNREILEFFKSKIEEIKHLKEEQHAEVAKIFEACISAYNFISPQDFEHDYYTFNIVRKFNIQTLFIDDLYKIKLGSKPHTIDNFFHIKADIAMMTCFLMPI